MFFAIEYLRNIGHSSLYKYSRDTDSVLNSIINPVFPSFTARASTTSHINAEILLRYYGDGGAGSLIPLAQFRRTLSSCPPAYPPVHKTRDRSDVVFNARGRRNLERD